jgi:hypothetical protein
MPFWLSRSGLEGLDGWEEEKKKKREWLGQSRRLKQQAVNHYHKEK